MHTDLGVSATEVGGIYFWVNIDRLGLLGIHLNTVTFEMAPSHL